jgi:hypothetical protein
LRVLKISESKNTWFRGIFWEKRKEKEKRIKKPLVSGYVEKPQRTAWFWERTGKFLGNYLIL